MHQCSLSTSMWEDVDLIKGLMVQSCLSLQGDRKEASAQKEIVTVTLTDSKILF